MRIKRFRLTGYLKLIANASAFVFAVCMIFLGILDSWSDTQKIDDPIQKGMAYIAWAIVFHAFFGSRDVTVKMESKVE